MSARDNFTHAAYTRTSQFHTHTPKLLTYVCAAIGSRELIEAAMQQIRTLKVQRLIDVFPKR